MPTAADYTTPPSPSPSPSTRASSRIAPKTVAIGAFVLAITFMSGMLTEDILLDSGFYGDPPAQAPAAPQQPPTSCVVTGDCLDLKEFRPIQSADDYREHVFTAINERRRDAGMTPLVTNAKLQTSATAKANDLVEQKYWSHYDGKGKAPWEFIKAVGYPYRAAGENLAKDYTNGRSVVDGWMGSPTHKENLLSSQFSEVGIGIVISEFLGIPETAIVVAHFGTP